MKLNYTKIEKKIEQMIKNKIKSTGLVDTGALLKSIRVKRSGTTFRVQAEDYYKYLDDDNNITNSVFNSSELAEFIENDIGNQIEKDLDKQITKFNKK